MSGSFEKSVKGGTKPKLAAPKAKYVEHILLGTQSGEAGVAEVFRTLTLRVRDPTWTIAFKGLIIVHLMINHGAPDVTLRHLSVSPKNKLALNAIADVQTQGQNIRAYADYLISRAKAYTASQCDYVRAGEGRMKRLTIDKGLLRETELLQEQVRALVKCDLLTNEAENDITLAAFRILTGDLLTLYNVVNEAVMNVLGRYFEMSKPDAERAIKIYRVFCKQTDAVVGYLSVARQYERATRLVIPKIKHAPTGLANSLQEYLDDPDFDTHRRQYLAEQEAKKMGKAAPKSEAKASSSHHPSASVEKAALAARDQAAAAAASSSTPAKGPAPDLMDFFESIEQNQQPMAQNVPPPYQQQFPMQAPQQTGFIPQQTGFPMQQQQTNNFQQFPASTNPFGQAQQQQPQPQPLQTQFTGAGFGGYGPQPQQQQAFAPSFSPVQQQPPPVPQQLQPQQTSSNPFRQSMMPSATGSPIVGFNQQSPQQQQSTNPFARSSVSPLQAQPTGGTNPFARPSTSAQPPMPNTLQVQPTGSTNPFRQSQFVNSATGQGWQHAPQATMGGLENLETIPVFPRPGTAAQTQQQSPWG